MMEAKYFREHLWTVSGHQEWICRKQFLDEQRSRPLRHTVEPTNEKGGTKQKVFISCCVKQQGLKTCVPNGTLAETMDLLWPERT